MKTKRNLSGIYFRCKESDGSWSNRCFEDLSHEEQYEMIKERDAEWLRSLAFGLANIINELGDKFDIIKE